MADEPDNLDLETRDLNNSLTRWGTRDHYDLIHSRCVGPGIKKDRWRGYVRDIFRLLRPGGWAELSEWSYYIQSDNGSINEQSMVYQWTRAYRHSMDQDRDPRIGRRLGSLLSDAGFSDVHSQVVNVPIGGWHDCKHTRFPTWTVRSSFRGTWFKGPGGVVGTYPEDGYFGSCKSARIITPTR